MKLCDACHLLVTCMSFAYTQASVRMHILLSLDNGMHKMHCHTQLLSKGPLHHTANVDKAKVHVFKETKIHASSSTSASPPVFTQKTAAWFENVENGEGRTQVKS